MAAEEDKKFDAVLGGFLVNDLRIRAGDLHCPDSDTLAAYHERSLLREEMNSWKEHIVGCPRCQAILTELEATDSMSPQVSEREEVLTATAGATAAPPEPGPLQKEALVTLPGKSRVTVISRRVRWQWLVPAGAIAAGFLVWVGWRENRPLPMATTEIKTAKLEPPATPPSASSDDRESISADELARVSKDQSAIGGAVSAKPAPETKKLKQFEKRASRGRVAHSELQADKEVGARADTAPDSFAAANRARKRPAHDDKTAVAGVMSQAEEVQTLTADAQLQNQQVQQNLQAQSNVNGLKASGPNPSRAAEAGKKRKSESSATHYGTAAAATPAPAPPSAPVPSAFGDTAALRMASVISLSVISAGAKTSWRVGHLGMIEFSNDGGASWSRQVSNVSVELTAGSAPSEKVCWVVGQAGTILLTTDAGAHWATIRSPLAEDLSGVRATDALHATIWNLGNTKTFETSDGGSTWKAMQAQ